MANGNKASNNSQGKAFVPTIKSEKPLSNVTTGKSNNAQDEVRVQENQLQQESNHPKLSTLNHHGAKVTVNETYQNEFGHAL